MMKKNIEVYHCVSEQDPLFVKFADLLFILRCNQYLSTISFKMEKQNHDTGIGETLDITSKHFVYHYSRVTQERDSINQ